MDGDELCDLRIKMQINIKLKQMKMKIKFLELTPNCQQLLRLLALQVALCVEQLDCIDFGQICTMIAESECFFLAVNTLNIECQNEENESALFLPCMMTVMMMCPHSNSFHLNHCYLSLSYCCCCSLTFSLCDPFP